MQQERDFDKHAEYVRNEPAGQEILATNDEVRDYFEVKKKFVVDFLNDIVQFLMFLWLTFTLLLYAITMAYRTSKYISKNCIVK